MRKAPTMPSAAAAGKRGWAPASSVPASVYLVPSSYVSKYGLTVHTASHKRQVPFGCLLCGMKFAAKGKFRGHVCNHSLERPHACHLCPANFIQKYHLRSHLITHSNEKPHRCNVCQKGVRAASCTREAHARY
ncbi:hypothetical protein MRX96_029764 [Rhipicephalus microplus]